MAMWADLFRPARYRATYSDINNFWYQPLAASFPSSAGMATPESALRTSVVWACVNLLSRTQAMLPAIVYRDLEDGGKERNHRHSVAKVLRRRPNVWQSRFEYRQYGMVCLLLRGNFYSRMLFDGRGALSALVPLHPDRVRPIQLDSGRMAYEYRPIKGPLQTLSQDDVSHLRGMTLDGVTGVSVIEYMRATVESGMAQEAASAAFYRQGMIAQTVVHGPKTMTEKARESLKADLASASGARSAGKTLLLEDGFTIEKLSVSARDAQYVESAYVTTENICRYFGVQPHMVQHLLRSTNNNIEQQSLEYVTYTLLPWNVAWEAAADRDYFADDDDHHLEFLVDMLLRGDTLSRYQAYAAAISNGIMSENEVRIRENLDPYPGLWKPQRSVNQGRGGGSENTPRPTSAPPSDDDDDAPDAIAAVEIVRKSAERLVRKEIAALSARAARGGLDRAWVTDFYGRHVDILIDALCLDQTQARQYGADHCALLLEQGSGVLESWERTAAERLVAMALGPKENGHHARA